MPVVKQKLIRHQALDSCFRNHNKRYYIEDLLDACNRALTRYDCTPVSLRTIKYDINEFEALYHVNVEHLRDAYGRVYYRYEDMEFSIRQLPLSEEELSTLKDTVLMLSRLKGLPQFGWMTELLTKVEAEVRDKRIDVRQVIYDGVVYKRDNLPLEQMKAEHLILLPKIKAIDKAVIAYLYLHCQPADRPHVVNLFNTLRYADHMKREVLPDLEQYRNELVDELNSGTHRSEDEFNELLFHLQEFEKYLKQVTSALNYDCMREFIAPEGLDQWRRFTQERHDYYSALTNSYNPQALNAIIAHADSLLDAFSTCDQCINGRLAIIADVASL